MTDNEKLLLIMKYFNQNDYYRYNEYIEARNHLTHTPDTDVYAILSFYRQKCYREMFDKIWRDISRILYDWQF